MSFPSLSRFATHALCLALLSFGACSSLATIEGGYQQPYDDALAPGHRGAAVDVHFGLGPATTPAGGEVALRTKLGSHQGQYAAAFSGYVFSPPEVVGVFARAGINVLQFETWSGHFAFGMGSPYVEGGVYFMPGAIGDTTPLRHLGGFALIIAASTGYDVRFTEDVPNSGWWSLTAGLGFMSFFGI